MDPFWEIKMQLMLYLDQLYQFRVICFCWTKVTSARLDRSYRRAPRGANQGKEPPAGICHLCMAGTDGPFLEWENQHLTLKKYTS